jgi:hypothetical protein
MSRYDDLRRMREAKFATTAANHDHGSLARDEATPVTKAPEIPVTKITSVTKRGRPPLGDKPMSAAERMRRYRAKKANLIESP